ncbi:ParB N-terminal domain-containing protein [Myxococcus sp. K38C18041901]|uniref:ParB/RepB/Spo0J family partition protein n=1 Tax=Myxococcus guangdongensis TaxID=2906760 RepID=UPI0020A718A0|nr:ParB N-terminal domain-containing protein [Myxococcus guangdongensis]MCP3064556.1 ParB N-terminal domain-containing protein [Myxococcus guangdongensis]
MPGSPEGGSSSAPEAMSARGDGASQDGAPSESSRIEGAVGESAPVDSSAPDAGASAPEGGSPESQAIAAEGAPSTGEPERSMESSVGSSEESQEKSPSESTPEASSREAASPSSEAAPFEEVTRQEPVEASPSEAARGPESAEAPSSEGAQASAEASGAEEEPDEESSELLAAPEERLAGRVVTVLMPLERLEEEAAYRLRPEGDVSGLATDIARLGQLFPVDVRPRGNERYQLVCGFRRVAALRFLKRDAVQARVHTDLSDEDALLMSLAEAIHATPVEPEVLEAKRDQLESEGRLSAAVADMLAKALATDESLAPEGVEEEIDADELAADVSQRLGAINQDLSLLADVFASLDESRRAELLMQLRYSSELVAYLEGLS